MRCDCSSYSGNRGQIDRFQAADLLFELAELALPLRGISLGRQRFQQRGQLEAGLGDRGAQSLRPQPMFLLAQAQFRELLAMLVEGLLEAMALLFERAQMRVMLLHGLARLDHLPIDQQALVEMGLAFAFEASERIVA